MEDNTLKKRVLKGTFAAASEQLVNIVSQLILVPLFISKWGVPLYGEWLLLFTFPAYLTMSDFGFAKAAVNSMTLNYAINDIKKVNQYYQSCFVLISIVSAFILIATLFIINFADLKHTLNISILSSKQICVVILFLIIYVLLTQQNELLAGIISCAGLFTNGMILATFYRFIEFLTVAVLLFFNQNPVTIAASYMVVRLIKVLHLYIYIRIKFKWIRFGFQATKNNASIFSIRELTKPAFAFMMLPIGNALRNQLPIFLLGVFLNPASIVVFTTIRTIVNMGTQFIGLITKALTPEYAVAYAKNDFLTIKKIYYKSTSVSLWLSMLMSLGIIIFADLLLKIWLHNKIVMNHILLLFFLLSLVSNSIWSTASFLSYSINKHERQSFYFLLSCVLSGALTFLFIKTLGLSFSPVGILIGDVIMVILVVKINNLIVGSNIKSFLANMHPMILVESIRKTRL